MCCRRIPVVSSSLQLCSGQEVLIHIPCLGTLPDRMLQGSRWPPPSSPLGSWSLPCIKLVGISHLWVTCGGHLSRRPLEPLPSLLQAPCPIQQAPIPIRILSWFIQTSFAVWHRTETLVVSQGWKCIMRRKQSIYLESKHTESKEALRS